MVRGGEDLVGRETARFRERHGEREVQSWTQGRDGWREAEMDGDRDEREGVNWRKADAKNLEGERIS